MSIEDRQDENLDQIICPNCRQTVSFGDIIHKKNVHCIWCQKKYFVLIKEYSLIENKAWVIHGDVYSYDGGEAIVTNISYTKRIPPHILAQDWADKALAWERRHMVNKIQEFLEKEYGGLWVKIKIRL